MTARHRTWKTSEAWRTYVAGFLWLAGTAVALASGEPDVAGWLRVRLDVPGLFLLGGALVGGWNFFPKGVRALLRLRLDMNFLMTVAIIGALLIGEPIEAAAIAALFSFAELLEAAAVARALHPGGTSGTFRPVSFPRVSECACALGRRSPSTAG
jgi:Cd2+/Zn2+-exporting ATPase